MPEILGFQEALRNTEAHPRSVLLGNGFSIAQGGGDFNYSSLLDHSGLDAAAAVRRVFETLYTVDFEEVMYALEHAAQIANAYRDQDGVTRFRSDAAAVREALINAVREVHPGIRFDVPEEQRDACAEFLGHFHSVFTINYDLMLYWVILHDEHRRHRDGFGLGETRNGFRTFRVGAVCSTYYLHGALHLFLGEERRTKKRILTDQTIIDDIASTIRETGKLPLFVAEGTSAQKMERINSVPYLRYCYDQLESRSGSLFVFGHSATDRDRHIYRAIFRSQIDHLYFCVHQPELDWTEMRGRLAAYLQHRPNVQIHYIDAATVPVWATVY